MISSSRRVWLALLAGALAVLSWGCPLCPQLIRARQDEARACAGTTAAASPACAAAEAIRDVLEDRAAQQGLSCPAPEPPPTLPPSPPPSTLPPTPGPGPTPGPTPGPACVLAGEPAVVAEGHQPTLREAVLDALERLRPDCERGGTCLLGDETQQGFQARVEAELRAAALCAGQHGPGTDEIAVAASAAAPWEGYDVFTGSDNEGPVPPDGARRTVVWAVYRGAWLPPGTPGPTPPPSACGAPRPPAEHYIWGELQPTARWRDEHGDVIRGWDATLNVERSCEFCQSIGLGEINGVIRCRCPLRPECDPAAAEPCRFVDRDACEADAGAIWESDGRVIINPTNPAQATAEGATWLRVCTHSGVCSERVTP